MASTDYIHLYETVAEFNEEYSAENYHEPWVSFTIEGSGLSYNKTEEEKLREMPLTFEIISSGTIYYSCEGEFEPGTEPMIEYKKNDGEWTEINPSNRNAWPTYFTVSGENQENTYLYFSGIVEEYIGYYTGNGITCDVYDSGDIYIGNPVTCRKDGQYVYLNVTSVSSEKTGELGTPINVVSGDVVKFRGDNNSYYNSNQQTFGYTTNCIFRVKGNIMSMIDSTGYSQMDAFDQNYDRQFCCFFTNTTGLIDAGKLYLPATSLTNNCYQSMFEGCTSLTTAPVLPATTLAEYCYAIMFRGCTSLTKAPELPATTLANYCYQEMFQDCTSLTTVPELPALTMVNNCYSSMFYGCTSLTTAPEILGTVAMDSCCAYMFDGCTSLTKAPSNLPAVMSGSSCYNSMFRGCTSLTTAPKSISSSTATYQCCFYMFEGCTSLTKAPELPATTLESSCYWHMFENCTSLTTAPELPTINFGAGSCYNSMFLGCTNLNYIKAMFITNPNSGNWTQNWVSGVSSTGTFVKNSEATWNVTGVNGIPNGWTVQTA